MNDISSIEITELIPQRHPFVFIDSIVECSDKSCITTFKILEDNIFLKDGRLTSAGFVENIAQSAAAMSGYKQYIAGKIPALGFIALVTNLKILYNPKSGSILHTEIVETNNIMDASIIRGVVKCDCEVAAECELRIFIRK